MQIKSNKRFRIRSSFKWLSRIFQEVFFSPPEIKKKNKNNLKFNIFLLKPKIFKILIETKYMLETIPGHLACQISETYSPKMVSVDDVICFKLQFWAFLELNNKNYILEIRRSNWFKNTFLFENTNSKNLACDLRLSRDWPDPPLWLTGMGPIANGFDFWIIRAKVTQAQKRI